ncbi:hypothetical protein E2C06_03420 [Dankookia rubra]|uniref:Uncharacterized protein n=1 Tax=Dankookia rubra TaxID=1442381 RepID=A0A4R5QLY3_9PROT|nr:hypothetical protein [Dankookia rubra]TDH63898.1 hypothetical protein E2C06_03420 [Dankookia rubra]
MATSSLLVGGAEGRFELLMTGFGAGLRAGMDLLAVDGLHPDEASFAVGAQPRFVRAMTSHILAWGGDGGAAGRIIQIALLRDGTGVTAEDFMIIA